MDEVGNDYIEKALGELMPLLGVKEPVDHNKLVALINANKIKEAIKSISSCLGLPVEVKISYVPNGYIPGSNDGFKSTHLVKTDDEGKGISGITAQVEIPRDLPSYGMVTLIDFPIEVRLSSDCANNPDTLISVMAHELSHILLYSMQYSKKENEFYTDLTAMVLGFKEVMRTGRKVTNVEKKTERISNTTRTTTTTHTINYGYLSDNNFDYALKVIDKYLSSQKKSVKGIQKNVLNLEKEFSKSKKTLLLFESYLEFIDKHHSRKINQKDGQRIMAFHDPEYLDKYRELARNTEANLESTSKYIDQLSTYKHSDLERINKSLERNQIDSKELLEQRAVLAQDVKVLSKNISHLHKLKIKMQ